MRRIRLGMRWWLAGIFVSISILTAALVDTVSSRTAETSVRSNEQDVAVGKTVTATFAIERAIASGTLDRTLLTIARQRDLGLFVFDADGRLLSARTSLGIDWRSVPSGRTALSSALADRRFVATSDVKGATLIALPLRRTPIARALVAYAPRSPDYARSLAIFHREVLRAALWAVLVAAAAGLLAAAAIARRLRRIDAAAAALAEGDFSVRLRPVFRDEVGSLALSIDRMGRRLGASFDQLRAERDRLDRLLEQLHEGVIAVDSGLVVHFANSSAERLLGLRLPADALLPEPWPDFELRAVVRGLFREEAAISQARVESEGGRILSLVGVPAGASELAVVVLTDITEHERRERAEREFVANASHELRTPVTAIATAVEALQAGAADDPADRVLFIDLIGRQAARLGRLTRSLLVMARAETLEEPIQLEPVRLLPLIEGVVASNPAGASVDIRIDCPGDLAALAQADIAEQVVSNLLGNAIKHTTEGSIVITGRAEESSVVLEIADTGHGIPRSDEPRIFDRFYSSASGDGERDGFGLGLAIVRDAVRAMGGSVEIESDPGRGTTARVRFAGDGRS